MANEDFDQLRAFLCNFDENLENGGIAEQSYEILKKLNTYLEEEKINEIDLGKQYSW